VRLENPVTSSGICSGMKVMTVETFGGDNIKATDRQSEALPFMFVVRTTWH
jgi:hypothetical protein